jgi:hypothetical protein
MNLKFPAILVSDCSTEDVCHCPGAENLDHYCNGSISSHLEIRAIESHLLVCKSCQLKLEELDVFVATLRESEFFLKASPPPTEPRRLLLPAGLYPLASLALIFALAMLFLMIRVPEPSTNFKQLSLTSTRSASVDTQLAAKALTLDIDSPALITTLPYSLRLLSSDGFIVKSTPQQHSPLLSLPMGLPPGQYWVQLLVSGSIEPLREYGVLVKSQQGLQRLPDFVHNYFPKSFGR